MGLLPDQYSMLMKACRPNYALIDKNAVKLKYTATCTLYVYSFRVCYNQESFTTPNKYMYNNGLKLGNATYNAYC